MSLDEIEARDEADAEYDNAFAEVERYDGDSLTIQNFSRPQMRGLKRGDVLRFDHADTSWDVVEYDASSDVVTLVPQGVLDNPLVDDGEVAAEMVKYRVSENGFEEVRDGREDERGASENLSGDAQGSAVREGTGEKGGEGDFSLDGGTAEEIKAEEKRRRARAEIERRQSAPLKGGSGETGQSLLDLGGAEGEDLFNRTAQEEATSPEPPAPAEELPQGIERRANGYAVRGTVYRSADAAKKALEKERTVFRQGDVVALVQDGERLTGTINRAPDGSLSVHVREPGRNRYEPAKVRDVKVKDRKNLTKLIDGGTRWKRGVAVEAPDAVGANMAKAEADSGIRFKKVTDPKVIAEFDAVPHATVYHSGMMVPNVGVVPPMAAKIKLDGMKKPEWNDPANFGDLMEAEEHPELIIEKGRDAGKYPLRKYDVDDTPLGTVNVAYDPYLHMAAEPENPQFTSAWERPAMKVYEYEIAEDDTRDAAEKEKDGTGYRAERAYLSTGANKWPGGRTVYLTRYARLVREMPWSEVADMLAPGYVKNGTVVPWNTVSQEFRDELRDRGVKIGDIEGYKDGPTLERARKAKEEDERRYEAREATTYARRLRDWLSPRNIDAAKTLTREEIFQKFGNELEPIATIPEGYLQYLSNGIADNRVYSGKGYLIDHAVNHHPEVATSDYFGIQGIINNADDVKLDDRNPNRNKSLLFIKNIGKSGVVIVSFDEGENGKIVLHKSFFTKIKKGRFDKLQSVKLSSEVGNPSISHAADATPAVRLSALEDGNSVPNLRAEVKGGMRFKRTAEASDTDYYFGAKESFDAHGMETYTAKDLGISTTDEAVLAAAHRYARDFRRVKQLMDDAILGRERTYTPVDVVALTVKHRDLQHDLADVLRRMETSGNPGEFQAEKELIEAQLDNVARASSIIGTKTGQTLRSFRIGISDDIRDSEAYILQSMRVNKQRKGLGSELTDAELAKAKQMAEQLKAENEKLKAKIAELEAAQKKNLKTQVEATDRPKRTAARKAAKTPSTEQKKKDFAKKYGHSVSDSGAKAWNLLARLSGKTTAMFKGGKGTDLTPDMMDAFAQIVEDMGGDYEAAASAIKDNLPDMAGAFAQFRSSMEKRDKSDVSTLAENFRKVVVPKHGLAELAQPITDQRLVTTKDLEGAREECKRQLDENEGNPREQRIALGHYLRRYRDALINENPDIPMDELNEKMAAEATALTGAKHDAVSMLAVSAGVDGYDLETRAEIQRKIARAQHALALFRQGRVNEAARESGLLYEDEATALAEMEDTLRRLMQEKSDEIDYLGTFSEKNKEAVERVKQLKEEIKEMNGVLHLMRKEAGMAEKKAKYAEVLEKRLAEAQRNADKLLGEIDSDEFKERKAKAETKVAELKAALAVAKRDENTLKKIKDRIAELEKRIADGDYDRQLLQIRANDAELQAKIRMQRERRNALRRKLDEERRRMSYREMGIVGKTWEGVKGILGEMKSVVASFDLSSVLRQGGQLTWAHPFIAAKNLRETLKAFKSEEYADKLMAQLRMRPNWQYYEKAGIDFTDWGEGAQNKEDVYLLNQYRKITNMKFIKSGVQMSERAFSMFLNLMRADVFDAMTAGSTFGSAANMNDSQLKAMGRFINIASQRGAFEKGGKFANAIPLLNVALWSPRNMASRFQFLGESARLLTGGAAYGDKTMRKVFAKELVRYIGGMSAAAMFLKAMAELFRDDDDPPDEMEFDPRSSDFLKVRFGNIRIDMTSGLTPIIVLGARTFSRETKNLRGQFRKTDWEASIGRFGRQKLAPGWGLVYDLFKGEDFEKHDIDWTSLWEKDAEHISAYRYLFGSFMPLTGADLLEQAQIGGVPKTFVTGFLSVLGANVQAFDPYNYKQMKGDYTYFRGLYDKATDPEEKRHLLEYHPMLKRRDRIEAALKRVRDLDKMRKVAEKNGQSRPDLDERIKEAKQKAIDAIAGF